METPGVKMEKTQPRENLECEALTRCTYRRYTYWSLEGWGRGGQERVKGVDWFGGGGGGLGYVRTPDR